MEEELGLSMSYMMQPVRGIPTHDKIRKLAKLSRVMSGTAQALAESTPASRQAAEDISAAIDVFLTVSELSQQEMNDLYKSLPVSQR